MNISSSDSNGRVYTHWHRISNRPLRIIQASNSNATYAMYKVALLSPDYSEEITTLPRGSFRQLKTAIVISGEANTMANTITQEENCISLQEPDNKYQETKAQKHLRQLSIAIVRRLQNFHYPEEFVEEQEYANQIS